MAVAARGGAGRGLRVIADIDETEAGQGASAQTSRLRHIIEHIADLDAGTSDGQIDRVWSATYELTTTPVDLDLTALTSQLDGSTVGIAELTGIVVTNDEAAGAGDVQVGGDAASVLFCAAANDTILVKPMGILALSAPSGYTVTNTTADVVQIAASTGTITCRIMLYGRSA